MKILYILPSFQHPAVRGPNRHYHFIRELSQRHAITLLTLARSEISKSALDEMAGYTERMLIFEVDGASGAQAAAMPAKLPRVGGRIERTAQFRKALAQMKSAFAGLMQQGACDQVLFHGKSVFSVIEDWDDLPLAIDFCDATSMRLRTEMRYAGPRRRLGLALRYFQTRQVEKKLVGKTPHIAFISHRDREAVLGPEDQSELLPNGVDVQYWKRASSRPQSNCLIFTGVMNYKPNDDAARYLIDRILPIVRRSAAGLEVLLVGRDPSPALLERAGHYPDVTVTGTVDDMRPHLERAAVCAAPLRVASGMQNKVLEAMAMGVPVVTTSIVAAGLRVDGAGDTPVHVADGEQAFAERIIQLLGQDEERARLAAEGRRFVENHFVWSRSAEKLEQMCLAAARGSARRGQKVIRN